MHGESTESQLIAVVIPAKDWLKENGGKEALNKPEVNCGVCTDGWCWGDEGKRIAWTTHLMRGGWASVLFLPRSEL